MQKYPLNLSQGKKTLGHTKIYEVSDQLIFLYKKCNGAKEYFVFNKLYNPLLSSVILSACQQENIS